jgi:hypothetical protein
MDFEDNVTTPAAPPAKLDLFAALRNIDNGKRNYYDSLSDAEKKLFVPVVILQWLACTPDPLQAILLNDTVNKYVFSLYKHPKLLYMLMVASSSRVPQRYTWRAPAKRKTKFPKAAEVVKLVTGYSTQRAIDTMRYLTNAQIVEMAKDIGYQQEEITALNAELKDR